MSNANLDHADLDAIKFGGLVREDVMEKIWQIDNFPLELTDRCAKGTHSNRRVEWTEEELAAPKTDNAVIDGADVSQNDAKVGARLGNYTQTSVKEVQVSTAAEAANSIGGVAKLARQISQRQKELRRDVEAQMLSHQASVAGDGSTTAGVSAGFGAQVKTNVNVGATGAAGGFNDTTGLFVAPTPGTKRALSEKTVRDILQGVYESGGNTQLLMARPPVIRAMSEYLFTSSARVATLTSEQSQNSPRALTAYGSVNVFVSDFGQTVSMVDNRLQQQDATDVSTMYFIDPEYIKQSMLRGYQTEALAKTGLSEKRLISVLYSFMLLNEKAQGAIFDIDETLAMVA